METQAQKVANVLTGKFKIKHIMVPCILVGLLVGFTQPSLQLGVQHLIAFTTLGVILSLAFIVGFGLWVINLAGWNMANLNALLDEAKEIVDQKKKEKKK